MNAKEAEVDQFCEDLQNLLELMLERKKKKSSFYLVCVLKSLQSHLTLSNPMDSSLPGSSVHGILQARILEWLAMPSSKRIYLAQQLNPHFPGLLHWQAGSLPLTPPGTPLLIIEEYKVRKSRCIQILWREHTGHSKHQFPTTQEMT